MARPEVPLRIHIAPVGFEVLRVTEPLLRMRADRAYLLTLAPDDAAREYWEKVHQTLQRQYKGLEVKDVFVNPWDLHAVIRAYGGVVRTESASGNFVFVNVSTGTKITAMAGLLASMFWGATAYYARTSYEEGTETVHGIDTLPAPRFEVLPKRERDLLLLIKREGRPLAKDELIKVLRKAEQLPPEGELSVPSTYRRLDQQLSPLIERKFVRVTGVRRAARIELTEEGWAALLLIDSVA